MALLDSFPEPHLVLTVEGHLRGANRIAWERLGAGGDLVNVFAVSDCLITSSSDVGGYLRACARSNRPLVASIQWPGTEEPQLCEGFRAELNGEVFVILRTAARFEASRRLASLGVKLEHQRSAAQQAKKEMRRFKQVAETDALTKVGSRRAFDEQVSKRFSEAQRSGSPFALLMIDADHFKRFNDAAGHLAGDGVLIQVAESLTKCLMRPGDFLARYGGEEFAGILEETDLGGGEFCADRILGAIRGLRIAHPDSPTSKFVTVSIGVASVVPGPKDTWEALLDVADTALYQAKQGGRDRRHSLQVVSRSRSTGS